MIQAGWDLFQDLAGREMVNETCLSNFLAILKNRPAVCEKSRRDTDVISVNPLKVSEGLKLSKTQVRSKVSRHIFSRALP